MKKVISVLCILALAITCVVTLTPTQAEAATKKSVNYPIITSNHCKSSVKKVYTCKDLGSAIDATYYGGSVKSGKVTITNIEILAPNDGTLFLQLVDGDTVFGSDSEAKNYKDWPVYAYYPGIDKCEKLELVKPGETLHLSSGVVESNEKSTFAEYPMAKGEKLYLYFTSNTTLKLSWVNTNDIVTITDYDIDKNMTFNIVTGETCKGISSFDNNKGNFKTLAEYFKGEKKDKVTLGITKVKISVQESNSKGVKAYKFTDNSITAEENKSTMISIGADIDINNDNKTVFRIILILFDTNLLRYNSEWVKEHSPQVMIAASGSNVIFGKAPKGETVCVIYNKKTYATTVDNNGFYLIKMPKKLSKGKAIQLYYESYGAGVSTTYYVDLNSGYLYK